MIQKGMKPTPNSIYLISYSGGYQFDKRRCDALITVDNEVLEGEVLDEVDVKGILTNLINWPPKMISLQSETDLGQVRLRVFL